MKEAFVEPKVELVQFTSDDVVMCESGDTGFVVFSGRDSTVSDK